ncbi:hypothetical protein M405DRAFT_860546 [Rhizopogon salebrosus TDB-379]|nr:hypothetical protein M405DRAFT_860546 [Rhizopogon salebrosus TDB-379]
MSDTHQDLLSTAWALASTTVVVDSAALPSAPKKQWSGRAGRNVLMTSAVKASRITPATAVVGMQGSINRIGDILERAMTAPPPAAAAATTSTSTSETRASDVLDHAMRIIAPENERAMAIYVRSPSADARHAYIGHLISTHMSKQA